jgi:methionyl aminopeptidase
MTIDNDDDLKHLKSIGRIVFETMLLMKKSLKPGISTAELDRISLDMALGRRPF